MYKPLKTLAAIILGTYIAMSPVEMKAQNKEDETTIKVVVKNESVDEEKKTYFMTGIMIEPKTNEIKLFENQSMDYRDVDYKRLDAYISKGDTLELRLKKFVADNSHIYFGVKQLKSVNGHKIKN